MTRAAAAMADGVAQIYGDPGRLNFTPEFSFTRDKAGLWSGPQVAYCGREQLATLAPRRGTPHPDFPFMAVDTVRVLGEVAKWVRLEITYAGALGLGEDDPEEENPPEYTLSRTLAEEPLETHPRYVDALSVEDLQEAVQLAKNPPREDDGTLSTVSQTGWDALKSELYDLLLAGQEVYRDPRTVWTKRWVSDARPDEVGTVGEIETPPGSPPSLPSGQNWLNAGASSTERGGVYENEATWEASGRGGWNSDLYGAPS